MEMSSHYFSTNYVIKIPKLNLNAKIPPHLLTGFQALRTLLRSEIETKKPKIIIFNGFL
jgi:hypothetical protein